MRNRIILISIAFAVWAGLKAVDNLVTGPELLFLLAGLLAMMISHSVWLFGAQDEWQRKARRYVRTQVRKQVPSVRKLLKSKSTKDNEDAEWNPWVDIFISAKNEGRVIATTVRQLFDLDYDQFYVWVIDDCSDDNMPEVLNELRKEYPRLRVVTRTPGSYPGKSAALNDALPLSKGEVIAVFDADAYVAPDFLKKILPLLAPEHVGAVQAQKRIYERQTDWLPRFQDTEYALDSYFQVGRDIIGGAVELRGNGELIKRNALIDVGGWTNKAITDDLDLSMKLMINNWGIRFSPDAVVWEEGVTTGKALMRQRRRWAEGSIRRYLDYIFPLNSPTRLSLVERLDTLVFTVYFLVPAVVFLEFTSDVIRFMTGVPTYGSFLALGYFLVLWVTQIDFFISVRIYRDMPPLKAFFHTIAVTLYVYGHWVPCILVSFAQILFGKQVSTWHRTEHVGQHTPSNV
ncbi:MAG: glycosyltransferase family 2 protein [Candidatus Obscuribacterales bacterium]|nr:glycosyltransferase family 2 protein [Candidatus Obscuribacterales bacterium]